MLPHFNIGTLTAESYTKVSSIVAFSQVSTYRTAASDLIGDIKYLKGFNVLMQFSSCDFLIQVLCFDCNVMFLSFVHYLLQIILTWQTFKVLFK